MKLRKIKNPNVKGQLKMSFGMIFTIILIIFFLVFAFVSIRKNIAHHDEIIARQLYHDLQVDIERVNSHEQALIQVNYEVPEGVQKIYFQEPLGEENPEGIANIYFDNSEYPSAQLKNVNWQYSSHEIQVHEEPGGDNPQENPGPPETPQENPENDEETKLLVFNVTKNESVSFYLIKKYGIGGVIIDADGIFQRPTREFYVGAPQDHGTYDEILEKGARGEYKILFNINFEDLDFTGVYPDSRTFRQDWKTGWGNRGEHAEIVSDPSDPNNKVMLITFPFIGPGNYSWVCWDENGECSDDDGRRIYFEEEPTHIRHRTKIDGVGPGSGGFSVSIPLGRDYEEVYLSYNIKHEPGWAAPAGGKLPGFGGSGIASCPACAPTDCADASGNRYKYEWDSENKEWIYYDQRGNIIEADGIADDFSARHMFHRNSHISYYYYDYDKINVCGDSNGVPNSAKIFDGDWHNVVYRVRMNDPGVANGVTETWIDGENHGAVANHLFRTSGSNFGIDTINFDNFFGGSGMNCGEVAHRFPESCNRGYWYGLSEGWINACAIDPEDPCRGVWQYEDGTYYDYWSTRKTEYIHFDDIVAYIPY